MKKNKIRTEIKALNMAVDFERRSRATKQIITQLERCDVIQKGENIALFASLSDEPDTRAIIDWLTGLGKQILLPRIEGDDMELYPTCELRSGSFGILEPQGGEAVDISAVDIILIPGVAFTRGGARLGRGRGFYDRYLARKGRRAYLIGLCYEHQLLEELPCLPHDVFMDEVICG